MEQLRNDHWDVDEAVVMVDGNAWAKSNARKLASPKSKEIKKEV